MDKMGLKEQKWEKKKALLERKNKIKEEKAIFKKRLPSTSKILIAYLFFNCTLIELFTCYVILKSFGLAEITGLPIDFSPLTTLIGSVVGEVVGFAIYALKSTKENTKGGIIYDKAMMQKEEDEEALG